MLISCILLFLLLPITRNWWGRIGVFAILVLTAIFSLIISLDASPEGGSHRRCPIALARVSESKIDGDQWTYLGTVGLDDLVLGP